MSDDPSTPSLTDLLKRAGQAPLERVYVSLPARVESYDATRQCVNAQPWIKIEETGEDGRTVIRRHPVVTNCPVLFQRSGPFGITLPIEVGSTVLLHFASASLDRWLTMGGEVEPQDPRRHTLDDAFATGLLRCPAHENEDAPVCLLNLLQEASHSAAFLCSASESASARTCWKSASVSPPMLVTSSSAR